MPDTKEVQVQVKRQKLEVVNGPLNDARSSSIEAVTVSTVHIVSFPDEVLLRILVFLPLRTAALVCRTWSRLATDPELWRDFRIRIKDSNSSHLKEILAIPRLAKTNYLKFDLIEYKPTNEDILEVRQKTLDTFNVSCSTSLSLVDPTLLVKTILGVQRTNIESYTPTILFPMMLEGPSRLQHLRVDLSKVAGLDPAVFAHAVTTLSTLEFAFLQPGGVDTSAYVKALLRTIATEESRLVKLCTGWLEEGPPDLEYAETFATAVHKLEVAELLDMSSDQCKALFEYSGNSRLQSISFGDSGHLHSVPPQVFASRLSMLTRVDFGGNTSLVKDSQVQALFNWKESKIKELVMSSSSIFLGSLDSEVLATRLAKMTLVEMDRMNGLTRGQVETVLTYLAFSQPQACLTYLNLSGTDLSGVPPATLAKLIHQLKWARLCNSSLTRKQLEVVINTKPTSLKGLNLKGTLALKNIPPADLKLAENGIKVFAYKEDHKESDFRLFDCGQCGKLSNNFAPILNPIQEFVEDFLRSRPGDETSQYEDTNDDFEGELDGAYLLGGNYAVEENAEEEEYFGEFY